MFIGLQNAIFSLFDIHNARYFVEYGQITNLLILLLTAFQLKEKEGKKSTKKRLGDKVTLTSFAWCQSILDDIIHHFLSSISIRAY